MLLLLLRTACDACGNASTILVQMRILTSAQYSVIQGATEK